MVRETRHLWVTNQPEIVREDRIRDHFKRNIPTGHHRVSGWYDSSPSSISTISGPASSPAPRSVYGNVASAVVQPDTSLYDCQVFKNKKKSRSGSESPCGGSGSVNATSSHSSSHIVDRGNGGSAASSRSHSRSPSSCSSTNSTSSNSHASSPVSGSDPPLSSTSSTTSRTRNLQSAVSAPNQSGNPVVHSEDNRPLAICVRNLPARSSDTSLKDGLFHEYKKHGKVTWVKVVGQNSERYALVCFKKPDDVEKALEVSHDKLFFGCKIEVAPYQGYDVEDNEFRPYEAELDEYHPKSTRTLFIGNLEKDITGSDIRNHFECFGEIIEIDIKKQGLNAYAFCQYSDIVSVVKAMRKMDGEHLGNNRIKLGFGKSMPTNCVWIDGIVDCVSENYLSQQFKGYGPITEVVIDRDRKLALVSFEQVQYAQLAVKEMRGEIIRGRKLQVDFASRECRDKFCSKVEKQTAGSSSCNSTTERTNAAETASYVVSVPGTRFNRYGSGSGSGSTAAGGASSTTDSASTSQSRSRASSFSRHSNLNSTTTTGATTTTAAAASSLGGASSPGGTSSRGGVCSSSSISGGVVVGAGGNSSTTTSTNTTSTATGGTTAVAAASGGGGNGGSGSGASSGAGGTTPRGNRSRGTRHPDYDYAEQRFRNYDEYSQGSGASHDDESYNYPGNCTRSDSPQSRLGPIAGTNALDTLDTNSGRRRCDKSPGDIRNLQKERFQILEQLEECPSSGDELVSPKKRMKFDHSSHHHNHHHTISSLVSLHMNNQHDKIDQQLLLLQTQSTQPLQQSQLLSSSSATLLSTAATTPTLDCALTNSSNNPSSSLQPNLLIGDSNCDVISNHSNETSSSLHHRKCVEVRRLSECSSLKYGTQLSSTSTSSNSRRPSTELSGAGATTNMLLVGGGVTIRHTGATSGLGQEATTPMAYVAPHSVPCKRRRTGAGLVGPTLTNSTSDTNEHHSSRGRGHQLNSLHSHEASGGESADGSRPGTPLCDERPEVSLCEPRRIPRDKPHEPMMLPLPKFGIQFFQQHRVAAATLGPAATSLSSHTGQLYSSISSSSSCSSSTTTNNNNMNSSNNLLNNTSSSSALLNSSSSHSSLSNTLSSPPLLVGTRLSAPSFHHHHSNSSILHSSSHHHHHQMQQQQQQQQHHHHHQQQHHMNYHHGSHTSGVEQPPASPLRARSLSSNSSDSDMAPISTSPSIEERLKSLDEMYEIWSGGGGSISARSHSVTTDHHSSTTPQSRHKFLELDVNEVKPSEFVKRVLAKKSIFDDDLQRLKNISDKYEPVDFSNLSRGSLVSTSPGIPNLAATKTPVVGGNPAAKQTVQAAVFHSPGVNQLQRLNSPMNSPQAMSPYNSPSPSPIVTTAMVSKAAVTQQTVVPAQPAKGLQYPFPSHPPVVMTPTTPPAPGTPQSKPKIASITKSFSLQEKSTTQTAQPTVPSIATTMSSTRVLCKSASVPGSTNVGTVKTSAVPALNTLPTSNTKSEENADATTTSSSRRSSADSSSTKCAYQRSVSANTSKKGDKAHKHNHRNDSDKKMTKSEKSRSESIDKRKSHSEEKDDTGDIHEKDTAVTSERLAEDERPKRSQSDMDKETVEKPATSSTNQKSEKEKSGRKEKRRDKEEKDREDREKKSADHEVERRECEEREKKEREERDRKERERREKEEKDRREREDRERREQEEMSRKEREDRERREELARKEREERERKEREERDRKEREERERKEREERERKEREERERKEREECARREREERERREREEITRREREERERREREEIIRRDREERERKEREEVLRREREERERKEREEGLRREREERERRDHEERERREKEESERREKEKEERERREKEKEERERRESEEHQQREKDERRERERLDRRSSHEERDVHDRKDYDETHERRDRKDREDRRPEIRNCETKDISTKEHHHHDDISKPDENHDRRDHRNKDDDYAHFRQSHHHHKEEKHHHKDSNENHAMNDDHSSQKRRERRSSGSSPIRITKRRLSSQDSMENEESAKRMKINAESRKLLDRLDSKDSNRSLSKHHKSHSRASSISKNSEEKLLNSEERYRKDSGFDEKKSKDKEHKKYDKNTSSSHKYKKLSISMEKDDHEIRSPTEKSSLFDQHELRSSDDEHQQQLRHRSKKEHKEKKRHEYDEDGHRRSSDSKRHDNNRHDRKSTGRSEDGSQKNSGEKSRNKPPSRKMTQSSNDSDSDEPKKHSIFDILDDGPYVSMYDKVKARSCKNMQKQEEEKKIKAKFSQLKQSRAKREEKKRSTSYDGDSDSDFDDRQGKYKSPYKMSRGGFINSSSDDDGSTINRHKDTPISDSDSDARRAQYNRDRLNQLCDGDSSEGGSVLGKSASCKKISLKRNSRSTRIVSDSSDTETSHRIKNENRENRQNDDINIKTEMKVEGDELESKTKVDRFGSLKSENLKDEPNDAYPLKMEIKIEPNDPTDDFYSSHISESETNVCSGSAVESKDSVFEQLFSPDLRKKHKKSKKRQKILANPPDNETTSVSEKFDDVKVEKHSPTSMENVFDELKRESSVTSTGAMSTPSQSQFSEKKKHKERKDKKRDKSREDYEKLSKEERHRLKKSKKSSKSCDGDRYGQDTNSVGSVKRGGEKMEDIFGPISDDETQLSLTDSIPKDSSTSRLYENISTSHTQQPVVSAALNPYKQEPLTPKSHTVEENEENKQKVNSHAERERHRKERREKKRKERERTREQHALAAFQQKHEDENSVDLDEAGRALEAQLMEDSDNKLTEETTPPTATTHKNEMGDVFRFSDGDENSMEVMSHEKKEQSEPHKNKEKKKKKKRSKEERHQKREHHHHSSTHNSSLPQPPQSSSKLSIEITTPTDITDEKQEDLCKPSPSLPCLLDESPPHKNNSSAELNLSISPLVREQPNLISPIPKTPTICSAPKPSECKKKPDKFIPGFDVELDDKISESAVKSISAEFNSPIVDPIVEETKAPIEIPAESKNIDKSIEEKSRVVISQEETEDAVAALLGESFGTSTVDYSFSDDPCEIQPEEEEHATQVPNEAIIPEEEAEEMRKAVQSLSNEEIDMKPDTPQSEQDLQIDTDTEETEEDTTTSTVATRFESTSKVEVPQIKSQAEPIVKAPPLKPEPVETPKATENEVKPPVILNTASVITKNTNELKPAKEEVAPKTVEVKVESEKPPETEKVESVRPQTIFPPTPQKTTTQSPVQPPKISVPSNLPASRPQTQFVMQPPTISIPEQTHFVYPPINVMLSPRAGNEHRMPSPRHVQQGSQIGQQSPAQFVNVRVSSPHSPNMHRGPSQTAGLRHPSQLSPVMPQHVVIQQRQLMSPPGSTPPQPQPPSSTNLTLNRIPVQSVLAPISKPIQPTNIILPQPNTAHASIVSRSETTSETKDSSKPVVGQPIAYQSVRVGTPTSGSAGSPVNTPGQSQSATIQVLNQPTIKSVIETHGASQIQQMGPIQVSQAKGPPHQTVVLQQQPPLKQPPHMPQSQSPRPPPPQQLQQMKIAQQQQLLQQHHLMQNRQHRKQLQQQQHKQLLQQQQAQQHAQMMQMQKQQQQQQQKHQQHSQQHQQQHRMMQQQVLQMQPYQQVQPQPLPKDTPHKATVSMPQQITQNIPNKEMQSTVCPPRISQNVVVVRQQSNIVSQSQQLSKPIIVQQQTQQAMSPQLPQTQQQPQPQPQQPQPVILQQRQPPLPLSQPSAVLLQSKPPPLPLPTSVQNVIHQAPAKVQCPLQPQPQEPAPPSTPLAINVKQQDDQICKVVENSESTVNPIEIKEKQQSVEPLIVEKISPKDDAPSTKESENVKITPPPMEVKKEPKVESKSLSPKQDLESVSVIKSQTAATPVQPVQSSLLTEENVSKFSVPVDDQLEQDSKEDSDYWSAKELNIESVIKKVDALCSNDEETEDQLLEKKGETKVDGLKTEPITVLKEIPEKTNAPSVVEQEQKTESVEIGSGVETEKGDDTHDEEEFDETTEPGKVSRGGKRTNRIGRGGKKMPSQPATTTANSPVPVNNAEGVQTRRGKNNQGVRGARKGRGGQSRSPAGAAVSVAAGEKKLSRNQNSDQDIYEFHDDSGEESVSSKSSDRPRLILTIKSPGQVASTVVQTKTAPSTPPQQTIPTVALTTPIPPAPVVQSQTPQPTSVPIATTPPQKDQKEKEEFTTPAINTRKSRRLLEKDGGGGNRNTVDDIIEDVVRNSSSPKSTSGGQTPPRRSTRNSAQVGTQRSTPPVGAPGAAVAAATDKVIVNLTDVRKSPRANRRSKDRKASETSVDSSDEKVVKPDEKSSPPKAQPVEIEAEKTAAKPEEVESTKQQPENPVKVTLPIPVVSNEKVPEKPETRKPLEPAEPLALIDPVTGLLTVVRQSKEGQYVPVPGAPAAPPNAKVVGKHIVQPIVAKPEIKPDELVKPKTLEPKQEAPSPLVVHKPTNVVVTTSIQPPTKVSSPISVVASSNIVQVPVPTVQVVVQPQPPPPQKVQLQQHVHQPVQPQTHPQPQLHAQPQPQPQPQLQPQPQKIIQSHPQPQPQPQPQPIRTHPLKAHVLNSQHNMALNKPPIVSQSVVKVATGIIGQPTTTVVTNPNVPKQPQQNTVVQSNIVTRHIPQSNVPQQPQQAMHPNQMPQQPTQQSLHNLFVNIPPSSSPHTVQMSVAHSPRIQQNVVVKSDQSQPSPQQPLQLLHVVTKPMGGGGQQQIITQQHQPVVIHNNKLQPPQNQYATVVQGGKIIQQAPIQNAVGKHQTIQVAIPHVQQQHQQLQHHQKQSPAVSVVTHQLGKQVPMPNQQQHQQPHPNMQSHHLQQQPQQQPGPHHMSNAIIGKQQSVLPNAIHLASGQQPGIVLGSQHIVTHAHQSMHPHQPTGATLLQAKPAHQQQVPPPTKGVIGLHQSPQIMTGAVASPPLKQSHMASQQPIVTGASSLRASVPPISPQGQSRSHMLQPGHPAPAFEANLGEGTFAGGSIRGMPREHYIMYPPYFRTQQEARIPYIPRSTLVQGSATDQKDLSEVDESMAASPPLELRRPGSGSRTISVPHSLQSPQDRATDSPQVAQVYVHGSRIPHPHFQDIGARYFENVRQVAAEPPPAHRPAHSVVAPSPTNYAPQPSPGPPVTLTHIHPKVIERERDREQRERENESRYFVDEKRERERVQQRKRENERSSIPGHTSMPNHDSLVPAMPAPTGRSIQVATPPHASQVPPQGDSLLTLLQRYPVMWQGLLALKTDQAAVQMHFVFGNPLVARGSLPCNSDGSTPPLRIAQRMRLEQTQLEGVAKKMQYENEHCMLLALPCGRNHMDVLQQSRNLQTGFITYLQQKMAAGIVNIPVPGSDQAAYVVHIFPSCDFANENLERAAPDLKHRVAEIAHLLIVIATV